MTHPGEPAEDGLATLASSPVRVLLVHNRYRFPGGEERHVDLLEKWLPYAGVDVRRFEVASPEELSLRDRVTLGLTLTYRPKGARILREALAQHRPDVVHFHNVFPLLTPAALQEARRYGAAVVLTIHNYRFACPAGTLVRNGRIHEDCIEGSSLWCGLRNSRGVWSESIAYGIAIELQRRLRLLHRLVDAYVTPSAFVATMLGRAGYPVERIHTISHGTPISDTPSLGGRYAAYVGRLSPEKGTTTLLEASRHAPQIPLKIAGTGPLASLVTANDQGISYLGYLDHAEVSELLRHALFTLMPSECYETQGYVALESMAVGTPVIASRLGALPEVIEDEVTGILVSPGDARALAAAMDELWADKHGAMKMGARAWDYAREHFAPEAQIKRLITLYAQLLQPPLPLRS